MRTEEAGTSRDNRSAHLGLIVAEGGGCDNWPIDEGAVDFLGRPLWTNGPFGPLTAARAELDAIVEKVLPNLSGAISRELSRQ
jgi:hypothetical protein